MGKFGWGILGTGNIASQFAADAAAGGLRLMAVASRDAEKAQAFAQRFGIASAFASDDALLADPEVDFVYIALPNSLHGEATRRAARAGKHILCEKPWVTTRAEAEALLPVIRDAGVFFMEAFMYRCHPQWAKVREWIDAGRIGSLRTLEARFGYHLPAESANVRNHADLDGGALLDVGCYPISLARWVTGEEPVRWRCLARKAKGVDEETVGLLEFPSGFLASFQCSMRASMPHGAVIYGEAGRIEIESPWRPATEGVRIACVRNDGGREEEVIGDGLPLYAREALRCEAFAEAKECPDMPWEDSLIQASVLEGMRAS